MEVTQNDNSRLLLYRNNLSINSNFTYNTVELKQCEVKNTNQPTTKLKNKTGLSLW